MDTTLSATLCDVIDASVPTCVPGAVIVFAAGRATSYALPLVDGELVLGRSAPHGRLDDERASRAHARLRFDDRQWAIADLGSRNGTFVDAERIDAAHRAGPCVLRIASTLLLSTPDVLEHDAERLRHADRPIIGARFARAWSRIEHAARVSKTLHITGETGTGKEVAARHFHESAGDPARPFVAINCATIPPHLAERILFGARRGAYTGATADASGLIAAADGGTLFLDEIGDLDPAVQGKLLRVIETGELFPLGASRPQRVDVRICSATHVDLDAAVRDGRFRADLRYRLATPSVRIPPLRHRQDEIPWYVQHELARVAPALAPHVSLVEACLLRQWPGNVRQLLAELRDAVARAQMRGGIDVRASDFEDEVTSGVVSLEDESANQTPSRHDLERSLEECEGNVSRVARRFGKHARQVYRWLERHDLDPTRYRAKKTSSDPDDAPAPAW